MMQDVDKFKYNLGQNVDIRDTKNKWVNGQIVYIKGNQAYIHYSGWSSRYDQYVDIRSDRILTQWEPGKQIKVNNRIDAYHPSTGWLEGRVVDIQYEQSQEGKKPVKVKAHYFNYHPKYDRWITYNDTNQMAMIGSRSSAYGIGKSRLKKKSQTMTLSQLSKKILELKVQKMIEELNLEDFIMKDVGGDGNCLFRSVSHQLYGSQQYHQQIRKLCLKYISDQKVFFQDYITQDLDEYVSRKLQDGIWGDDVQIQALSEIYGRPIEIYSTSAKPIRTFHEDNQHNIEPLRLAYVGSCHYNSIKKRNKVDEGLIETPFGQYQTIFTASYHENGNYHNNIRQFRQFFSNSNALDYVLSENVEASQRKEDDIAQRLNQFEAKEMNRVLQISETENILQQIEKSEMQQIQTKIQQEHIQEEIKRIEQREMQIAKQLSKKVKKDPEYERPYWFQDLLSQGFGEKQIEFAIEINGYDPDRVQNFLLDNM